MSQTLRVRGCASGLRGTCRVPGDKSISHRGLLLGAIAQGTSRLHGLLHGRDCQATLQLIRDLGVRVEQQKDGGVVVHGVGLDGLREPQNVLDCTNSGTTMRLAAGLLAGQPFSSFLVGTRQLQSRPMDRIVTPLRNMGAVIVGRSQGSFAPLAIQGTKLSAIHHELPVASAQVKSALLLAGLYAEGSTVLFEPGPCRDHTERMLSTMGAPLHRDGREICLQRTAEPLRPLELTVPGDPSSAAFLIVAATCLPGSELLMEGIGVNPTRHGLIAALSEMGARVDVTHRRKEGGEPVADLRVSTSALSARTLGGDRIVTMIDEIPVLAVAATQARGATIVADAGELRVKETDRVAVTVEELGKLGAQVEARPDGIVIHGPGMLRGNDVDSHGDHRIAMALTIAGLIAQGETHVHGAEVISDSFPGFAETLAALGADVSLF